MTSVEKEFLFLKKIKYFVLYFVFFTFVLYLGILVKYNKKHPFFFFSFFLNVLTNLSMTMLKDHEHAIKH